MKACNQCQGTGNVISYIDSSLKNTGILFETKPCLVCEGSGVVSPVYYKWYSEMLALIEETRRNVE